MLEPGGDDGLALDDDAPVVAMRGDPESLSVLRGQPERRARFDVVSTKALEEPGHVVDTAEHLEPTPQDLVGLRLEEALDVVADSDDRSLPWVDHQEDAVRLDAARKVNGLPLTLREIRLRFRLRQPRDRGRGHGSGR